MLEGREFTIFTDHKPLTHAFQPSMVSWTAVSSVLPGRDHQLDCSCPGKENVVPDALSRPYPAPITPKKSALFPTTGRVSDKSALFPTMGKVSVIIFEKTNKKGYRSSILIFLKSVSIF